MDLRADLIENTFSLVAPIADDAAKHFYERLFTSHPELQPLFAGTNMKVQRKMLMAGLAAAVNGAYHFEELEPKLRELGKRHVQYGVEAHHYPWVGEALLGTLEHFLEDRWTAELHEAWLEFYLKVAGSMQAGAGNTQFHPVQHKPDATADLVPA